MGLVSKVLFIKPNVELPQFSMDRGNFGYGNCFDIWAPIEIQATIIPPAIPPTNAPFALAHGKKIPKVKIPKVDPTVMEVRAIVL